MPAKPKDSYQDPAAVEEFDYSAPAELFMASAKYGRKPPVGYRRFESAAEALRFAVEELPASLLVGTVLEVSEIRFDHQGIQVLYQRDGYPLARRA
jgi:hypothetical protein